MSSNGRDSNLIKSGQDKWEMRMDYMYQLDVYRNPPQIWASRAADGSVVYFRYFQKVQHVKHCLYKLLTYPGTLNILQIPHLLQLEPWFDAEICGITNKKHVYESNWQPGPDSLIDD